MCQASTFQSRLACGTSPQVIQRQGALRILVPVLTVWLNGGKTPPDQSVSSLSLTSLDWGLFVPAYDAGTRMPQDYSHFPSDSCMHSVCKERHTSTPCLRKQHPSVIYGTTRIRHNSTRWWIARTPRTSVLELSSEACPLPPALSITV